MSPATAGRTYKTPITHGSSGYNRGCRCQVCKSGRATYKKAYYEANSEQVKAATRARRARSPEAAAAERLRRSHGLTPEKLSAIRLRQDAKCYLCGNSLFDGDTTIDHDHRCCRPGYSCATCRRGLACQRCNRLIGIVNDDVALLRQVADALEMATAAVDERMAGHAHQMLLPEMSANDS